MKVIIFALFQAPAKLLDRWLQLADDAREKPGLNGRCKCGAVIDAPHVSTVECWECAHWRIR
jgi:hypothetical protein